MTDELPPPPVPADCDLRAFPYMPLDIIRLRDSELLATATGDEFRAAVLLWCVSWHQVPAASLPKDDRALAHLAGYGRDLKSWGKVREAAMRGWYEASDGRLYHPVVAEKATEGWKARQDQKTRTEAARAAREAKRKTSAATSVTENATEYVTSSVTESKGERRERERERDYIDNRAPSSSPSSLPREDNPAATAATPDTITRKIDTVDAKAAREAILAGDLDRLVIAYGCDRGHGGEWRRDTHGMRLVGVAAILGWQVAQGKPIRKPSGFRPARAAWNQLDAEERKRIASDEMDLIGVKLP